MESLLHSSIFQWIILPILIFVSRIVDVSIGTIRLILISKGFKQIAPIFGFFEVLIWLIAITQIMQHLDNPLCYIFYAGGFATGTYFGIYLEEKLSIGLVILRIITKKEIEIDELLNFFSKNQFGVTVVEGEGQKGPVKIIFTVIKRQNLPTILEKIKLLLPNAFYTIEDVKSVQSGIFPENINKLKILKLFPRIRKGK